MIKDNDYDSVAAERQKRFMNGESKPHRFVEKPAMQKLLPSLKGKRVLMLGCGTGEESKILEAKNAARLVGIDISKVSIDLANKTYPKHDFRVGDINTKLDFEDETFDFVYSSLALDYADSPLRVYKEVYRILKNKGKFQFSVPHPVRWSSEVVNINGVPTELMGWSNDNMYPRVYGNYMKYAQHRHTFTIESPIKIWVGPPSMHFRLLKQAGFTVDDFIETQAIEETKKVDAYYFERFSKLPQFSIFLASK
jgi:SAM-dependent methyltransferase